jgi:hypothetical protein
MQVRPNKRLKLAGVLALREAECCATGGAWIVVHCLLRLRAGARSLTAIR